MGYLTPWFIRWWKNILDGQPCQQVGETFTNHRSVDGVPHMSGCRASDLGVWRGWRDKRKARRLAGLFFAGAEDEGRTRDLLLGKEALCH